MLKLIKKHILIMASALMIAVPVLATASVAATGPCNNNIQNGIASGINATGSVTTSCGSKATSGISGIAKTVINIFSLIVGIISVIMIIYAGFRYITSGGESGNTTGARNTLLFAVVGLIIVAIAQIIVRFVLNTASGIK